MSEPEAPAPAAPPTSPPAWRGRLGRLSPAHGWPSFFTELVVVVLGILLALGAQQAADWWNNRNDTIEFRAALDEEIAGNLAQYRERLKQADCTKQRLDQLEAWQRDWRDGKGSGIEGEIGRPLAYPPANTIWPMGANGVANRIPLDQRSVYAYLSDMSAGYLQLATMEMEVWRGLLAYDSATRLSPEEVNRLRGLILSARALDKSIRLNAGYAMQAGTEGLGIKIPKDPSYPLSLTGLCTPLRFTK